MTDLNKMDRTWLCSVVFMDIALYSSQSVELQMKWKQRFNGYLAEAIQDVPESERVILDTGDGAAVCFLGAPEAAMFAALQLCRCFIVDEREQPPGLRVRLGINLGPVKLVRDINGALNAIGDGINAGQRIMSFASANQILVSQSFFEVVSRLSDDYKLLFQLKGIETDKHVREYTVYHLVPPGSEKRAPARAMSAAAQPEHRAPQTRRNTWLAGGATLVVLAALGVLRSYGPAVPVAPTMKAVPAGQDQTHVPAAEPASPPAAVPSAEKSTPVAKVETTPTPIAAGKITPPRPITSRPEPAATPPSPLAKAAYDEAVVLMDQHKAAKAEQRFDDALRDSPVYVDAYVGRAQARRGLVKYELSLEDCNQVIRLRPADPRGYNCRGWGNELLKQYEPALRDFDKAISLDPNFSQAYFDRGTAYYALEQYDRALRDYNQAIRLRPGNAAFYLKRASVYDSLKQYPRAIQDCTEAIRLQPDDLRAYTLRASAEDVSGDAAAAAADRRHVQESRKKKKNDNVRDAAARN
jgi:class 3 adenylate cyclase/regulator of sirC expression with transglutaminase-like and TPR domain